VPSYGSAVLEVCCEVTGLLGYPRPGRVAHYPGHVDHSAFDVDEEKDIQPTEPHRVDVKEIAAKAVSGLGSQELRP
jgi:hypothetical protein